MKKSKAITVASLHRELRRQMREGNGKKKILLTSDDEGNSFHEMFYYVSKVSDCLTRDSQLPFGVTKEMAEKDYVILG